MKRSLFILIFLFAFCFFIGACATGNASFSTENRIGATVEFDGGSAFCSYDQDVSKGEFGQETTCSFTVKAGDKIYECSKIKLSSFGKDFKLETDCTLILDLKDPTVQHRHRQLYEPQTGDTGQNKNSNRQAANYSQNYLRCIKGC